MTIFTLTDRHHQHHSGNKKDPQINQSDRWRDGHRTGTAKY